MKTLSRLATAVAAAGLLAACENPNKAPADAALKALESSLAAVKDEAARYAPGQTRAVVEAVDAARAKFGAGQYKEALAAVEEATKQLKSLSAAVLAKKDELAKAWGEAGAAVPEMLGAVRARLAELAAMKKLPKELGAEVVAKANEEIAAAGAAWDKAQASFKSGAVGEAVAQAKGLPERIHGVMDRLGMHKH